MSLLADTGTNKGRRAEDKGELIASDIKTALLIALGLALIVGFVKIQDKRIGALESVSCKHYSYTGESRILSIDKSSGILRVQCYSSGKEGL